MANRRRAAARRKRDHKRDLPVKAFFPQEHKHGGLLVTDELENALEECKTRVEEIAQDCRQKNRKFRDIEFDLENDRQRCLCGLSTTSSYNPSDVLRATQIFDKPSFFIDGADSNDIVQGDLGDCWFLSALATMSTAKGLVEKFCVARDEQVGVYGFIFFRDNAWVVVVIDDLLFTSIPKFEELRASERQLYHNDKELYNKSARKSGKSLFFARSGTHGETWVPLIEKAYAKLHGNYDALVSGETGEAIEDLTGGVNTFIMTKDILDIDKFWNDELLHANVDRLFGCAFDDLDSNRSGVSGATVNGLHGGHAYSVLRAVEVNGKRFVVIRNPWGASEWTGPWSDGSKEWTTEWLPALEKLGHTFGDDGEFVMEYGDFLENWEQIDRIKIFDSTWVMSSQWLEVTARPMQSAWSFGDVSFTISLPIASPTVIVLSQLDDRYFKFLSNRVRWMFDFVVFRKGETKPITSSSQARFFPRSVNAEVTLEAGEYVVHVRLDRLTIPEPAIEQADDVVSISTVPPPPRNYSLPRNYSRAYTEMARSQSIASNFDRSDAAKYLPIPLSELAGLDLTELKAKVTVTAVKNEDEAEALKTPAPQNNESTDKKGKENDEDGDRKENEKANGVDNLKEKPEENVDEKVESEQLNDLKSQGKPNESAEEQGSDSEDRDGDGDQDEEDDSESEDQTPKSGGENVGGEAENKGSQESPGGEGEENKDGRPDSVFLGLRVYSKKDSPATIGGQLRHEMGISFDGITWEDRRTKPNNKTPYF